MKVDKLRVGKILDRRIKISKEEHPYIRQRYKDGEGVRLLARVYGVDKRLIQFILHPERQKLNLELRKQRGGSKKYYDKSKWKMVMREHRAYKKTIKDKLIQPIK